MSDIHVIKTLMVRDVVQESYSGDRSVVTTECVEVVITWPEGFDPVEKPHMAFSGPWRIASYRAAAEKGR